MSTHRFLTLGAATLALIACTDRAGQKRSSEAGGDVAATWAPKVTAVLGVPAEALSSAIRQRLESGPRPAGLTDHQWRHVRRLYNAYRTVPLWLDENGLDKERATALMRAAVNAHTDALRVDVYPLADLATSVAALRETKRPTAEQLTEADVLMTSVYAALGEGLLTGQVDPRSVLQSWHIDPQDEQVDSALVRTLRSGPLDKAIARMRPQDDDYEALRRELVRLRQIVARGGWPRLATGKALKPGDTDTPSRLEALGARLRAEGIAVDSTPVTPPAGGSGHRAGGAMYDARLAGPVAVFQERHGIPVDSILGAGTVASLNVPADFRLGQIAANLERHRWLPRELGARYVLVNVPAFRLEAYDGGRKALEMKVIVGAEYEDRATPVFSDSMEFVVFRPYWNVPDEIAAKELWPKISADPGYMARNNYETFREGGKARIRQKPGPKNALGLVKFMFPNDFDIYLHDTPDDRLFEKDVRAFSHGCIRLERPVEFAQFVLGWPPDRVRQAMEQGPNDRRVNLPRKIPVYIAYFTAYMRDGRLHFGSDLYDRDSALITAVAKGAFPDAQTLRTIQELERMIEG
jgi:murein L,D-transpeptidase YcbB/YkuD